MKSSIRYGQLLLLLAVLITGATIFSAGLGAQDDGWQIVRADYGFRNQRSDVTDILKDLIARGGVDGRVAVNNQTMGGDPAIGKDKSLRIFARNRRNEEREFSFNEGAFVDVRMFAVRRDDWDDRPGNAGGHYPYDSNGLQIIRGFYGVQGRTADVTEHLRRRSRDGVLTLLVTNNELGGDPVPGADKILIVVYRFRGQETATAAREGNTLTIP
jgi:hypothetical protein